NAQVPMDAIWHDEFGADIRLADALHKRPSVLIFADFTCSTLCGSIVSVAAELLTHTGLQPGRDFALVVLGLDAKDGVAEALAFKQQIADRAVASATKVLSASEVRVKQAAEAVGYRFAYDADRNQYAHPAAFNLPIALSIAAAKSFVVAIVFMELRERSGLMIAFAAAGFFWLFILIWLAGTDFLTRPKFPPGVTQRWHEEKQTRRVEQDPCRCRRAFLS